MEICRPRRHEASESWKTNPSAAPGARGTKPAKPGQANRPPNRAIKSTRAIKGPTGNPSPPRTKASKQRFQVRKRTRKGGTTNNKFLSSSTVRQDPSKTLGGRTDVVCKKDLNSSNQDVSQRVPQLLEGKNDSAASHLSSLRAKPTWQTLQVCTSKNQQVYASLKPTQFGTTTGTRSSMPVLAPEKYEPTLARKAITCTASTLLLLNSRIRRRYISACLEHQWRGEPATWSAQWLSHASRINSVCISVFSPIDVRTQPSQSSILQICTLSTFHEKGPQSCILSGEQRYKAITQVMQYPVPGINHTFAVKSDNRSQKWMCRRARRHGFRPISRMAWTWKQALGQDHLKSQEWWKHKTPNAGGSTGEKNTHHPYKSKPFPHWYFAARMARESGPNKIAKSSRTLVWEKY